MKMNEVIQVALFFGLLIGLTPLLGRFMARVFQGQRTFLHPLLRPVERMVYWAGGVDEQAEMTWKGYFLAVLVFNVVGILSLMGLEMTQKWLPLNPQHFDNVPWALALNTAISFITNTNWQAYSGENTMSYLTQMAGLAVHNFLSAATGIAVLLAVTRGLKRASAKTLGNFWVDLTRATLYVLLPLSVVLATALSAQGVVQNFKPYATAQLMESYTAQVPKTDDKGQPVMTNIAVTVSAPLLDAQGKTVMSNGAPVMADVPQKDAKGNVLMTNVPVMVDAQVTTQPIPTGPAASQIAIKQLGTNGGGFFGQNSAHPFENPTPLTNFLEMLGLIIIPAGLVYAFGVMIGDRRHAWCLFGVMLVVAGGRVRAGLALRVAAQPGDGQRRASSRRQGTAVRRDEQRAFGGRHHRHLLRRGQLHARQFYSAGRPGAALESDARLHRLRRRGRRIVWHPHACLDRGLYRRADDRAHAGISGQENSGLGRHLGHHCHPGAQRPDSGRFGRRVQRAGRTGRLGQSRPAWLERNPLRLRLGAGQQWQRLRRTERQQQLL